MPPRDDIAREWALLGERVAEVLPLAQVRRLLGIVRKLPDADPLDAMDAIALLGAGGTVPEALSRAEECLARSVHRSPSRRRGRRRRS